MNTKKSQRRSPILRGVFAALLMLAAAGCATSPQVSLLETDNRVLKEHNKIQGEELAELKARQQLLAQRLQEAEIELAKTVDRQTIRR